MNDLYVTSVLLQKGPDDGSTVSHSLHWTDQAKDHDEAIKLAKADAAQLRPDLVIVNVVCANTRTGKAKQSDDCQPLPIVNN